jgi:hypothetical protein
MKPREAQARVRARQQANERRGAALERYLKAEEPMDEVRPELIPDAAAHREAVREVRRLVRQSDRTPRSPRRDKVLDELVAAMRRLIYVERVLELEPLERAGLTPARLVVLSRTSVADVSRLAERMGLREGGG